MNNHFHFSCNCPLNFLISLKPHTNPTNPTSSRHSQHPIVSLCYMQQLQANTDMEKKMELLQVCLSSQFLTYVTMTYSSFFLFKSVITGSPTHLAANAIGYFLFCPYSTLTNIISLPSITQYEELFQ